MNVRLEGIGVRWGRGRKPADKIRGMENGVSVGLEERRGGRGMRKREAWHLRRDLVGVNVG